MPKRILTNFDLENLLNTTNEWIYTRTGIERRHVAASHETTSDLASAAAKEALQHACRSVDIVDLIQAAVDAAEGMTLGDKGFKIECVEQLLLTNRLLPHHLDVASADVY